jgi:hypothetical protein
MDQANAASNPSIARDYIKTGCAWHSLSNSNYKNRFFKSPPLILVFPAPKALETPKSFS